MFNRKNSALKQIARNIKELDKELALINLGTTPELHESFTYVKHLELQRDCYQRTLTQLASV
jgi:hypothetical protein